MSEKKPKRRKWPYFLAAANALVVLAIYGISYVALSTSLVGTVWAQGPSGMRQVELLSRSYRFDPWIYQPLAGLEAWARGPLFEVVLEDGTERFGLRYVSGPYGL